jgi:uncharacterized protein YaaN involved in tellurite resistance
MSVMTAASDKTPPSPAPFPALEAAPPPATDWRLDPLRRDRIEALINSLDLTDSTAVLTFGAEAQEQLTQVSETMLEGVRTKDLGPTGETLNAVVTTLRGFNLSALDPQQAPGWFGRLFGGSAGQLNQLLSRYQEVRTQLEAIGDALDRHKSQLMVDIAHLDRLYDATLAYFHDLADFIAAGREKLRQLDEVDLPALERSAAASGDVLDAQRLRDLRAARDDLERRVHDLELTRQVTMQSLPSIRLVQENNKSLVNKITSVLANTVPLWRTQLAQAITLYRSRQASGALKGATDLTNELLKSNAEMLKQANIEIRTQVERGIVDIETVTSAHKLLIETLEDTLRIAQEGRERRVQAESQLRAGEAELRSMLAAARLSSPRREGG